MVAGFLAAKPLFRPSAPDLAQARDATIEEIARRKSSVKNDRVDS
jgi:hypothetical protein